MGAYLSEPVLEKHSSDEENVKLSYGASSMQGWRVSQEVSGMSGDINCQSSFSSFRTLTTPSWTTRRAKASSLCTTVTADTRWPSTVL